MPYRPDHFPYLGSSVAEVVRDQNPWRQGNGVPPSLRQSTERPLGKWLWGSLLSPRPERFHLILGPRRVGKTTTLYQTVHHLLENNVGPDRLLWLRLDHPVFLEMPLLSLLREALGNVPRDGTTFLFLDELTYARDWDKVLKTLYDDRWPVRVAGSSSSTYDLRVKRPESGVGRWEEHYLAPYLLTEVLSLHGQDPGVPGAGSLAEMIRLQLARPLNLQLIAGARRRLVLSGGFPELLAMERDSPLAETDSLLRSQRILRTDAIERAIYKDIPQAVEVRSPALLERLLYMLAGQIGQILSPVSICQTLDTMSAPTLDRYLSHLERSLLVFLLPNYASSEEKIQKRGRKVYFHDGAVRNAALQRGTLPLQDPAEMGRLLENMAAAHLHTLAQQTQARLYFWRERDHEVDLVYDDPQSPMAFEISVSKGHRRAGLREFIRKHDRFAGNAYVVSVDAPDIPASQSPDAIGSISFDRFLVLVGALADDQLRRRVMPG